MKKVTRLTDEKIEKLYHITYQNTINWLAFVYCVDTAKGEYCTENSESNYNKKENP